MPNQWHYVETKSNPADIASRGAGAQELIDNPLWWNGPEFLWNSCEDWDSVNDNPSIPPDDPEVKKVSARATQIQDPKLPSVLERLTYFSSWYRAKKAIAVCLRLQQKFRKTAGQSQVKERNVKERNKGITSYNPVDVKALQRAELQIIKMAQSEAFREEIRLFRDVNVKLQVADQDINKDRIKTMKKSSSLYKLDPFLDEDGVLRVGGRLGKSSVLSRHSTKERTRDEPYPLPLSPVSQASRSWYHSQRNQIKWLLDCWWKFCSV